MKEAVVHKITKQKPKLHRFAVFIAKSLEIISQRQAFTVIDIAWHAWSHDTRLRYFKCTQLLRTKQSIFNKQNNFSNIKYKGCSVSGDTLQYRLEESVYHWRTRQVTQLFTYLLTQKLFSSCIRQYLVSRDCDWVMPALSAVLLIFNFQFSLLFLHISLARLHQHCGIPLPISDIGRWWKLG